MIWMLAALGCDPSKDAPVDTGPAITDTQPPGDTGGDSGTDCDIITLYYDGDGDGHGDPSTTTAGCEGLEGWSSVGDDCDDADSTVWEDCDAHACWVFAEVIHSDGVSDTGDTGGAAPWSASQYWVCEQKMGWQEGRQYCFDHLGGDLVAMNEAGEFAALQAASELIPVEPYWVGVNQPDTAPTVDFGWTWISAQGTVEGDSWEEGGFWHVGQPDNGGEDENTAEHEEDVGAWVDNAGIWALMDERIDQDMWPLCEVAIDEATSEDGG